MDEAPRRTSLVPLAFPCSVLCLLGVETEGLLDYQGRAGIISIVQWSLRPVIFGVESVCLRPSGLRASPPLTEVSRALRARNAEKVSKMSPGASGPGTPKSLQKVSGTVREDSFDTFRRLPRLFPRLFGDFSGSRGRRPRDTFSRLFRHFGREGPERPL